MGGVAPVGSGACGTASSTRAQLPRCPRACGIPLPGAIGLNWACAAGLGGAGAVAGWLLAGPSSFWLGQSPRSGMPRSLHRQSSSPAARAMAAKARMERARAPMAEGRVQRGLGSFRCRAVAGRHGGRWERRGSRETSGAEGREGRFYAGRRAPGPAPPPQKLPQPLIARAPPRAPPSAPSICTQGAYKSAWRGRGRPQQPPPRLPIAPPPPPVRDSFRSCRTRDHAPTLRVTGLPAP